jgi:hypothetical protein
MLMLMLICCERKTLLNGWLIQADKFKRTRPDLDRDLDQTNPDLKTNK